MSHIAAVAARAQRFAESIMLDTCIARRPTGVQSTAPVTFVVTEGFTDLFTSKCRLRDGTRHPERSVGQAEVTSTWATLELPAARDTLRVNDVVEILTSQSPGMVGRKLRVMAPWLQTSSSACRYPVSESTIPDMAAT